MTTATSSTTRTYQIDKAHSEAIFQVRHLLSKVRGRFSDFEGSIEFDEQNPENSKVDFTVHTGSIDTNQPDRDAHLRSADFFSVDEFPTLTFKSTGITRRAENRYDVAGDLTMHGVTKRVVLPVEYLGKAKDPWGNDKVAFEGEITLNRKDYGLNWNAALETGGFLVGDEVRVNISIQAAPKQ
jgi:polyisoprenoid-binding protein YceI